MYGTYYRKGVDIRMKQSYKLPTSLDKSYLDHEVALQTKGGVGLRPLPLKVILVWIGALFFVFMTVFSENLPMHYLPIWGKILYGLSFIAFVFFVTTSDGGGQPRYRAIRNMGTYMFRRSSRIVRTRNTDNATAFYHILNIKDISDESGMIMFMDGTYGYAYRVVGNASALLFDSDKEAIINRVDNFYRKMPDYIRMNYITIKEPQKVVLQKQELKKLYNNRDNDDKDIQAIIKASHDKLDKFVGGEFKSIHQYLILIANSKEYANKAHSILASEFSNSSLMFSAVEPLYKADVCELLHRIYAGE